MDRRQDEVVFVEKGRDSSVARGIRRIEGELGQEALTGREPRRDLLQLVQVSPAALCIRMKSLEVGLVPGPHVTEVGRPACLGRSQSGLSDILCAGPVDHHAVTNLPSKMMANWVLASHHSRGGI